MFLIQSGSFGSSANEFRITNPIKQGQISEDDVLNAIEFLVENQIIRIDTANQSMEMMNQDLYI